MKLDVDITVAELMARHPAVLDIFLTRKMLCIGCPAQDYHTLREVTRIYGFDLEEFLGALKEVIHGEEKA